MAKQKKLTEYTVDEAARMLIQRYGQRASKVASDRYDAAERESTAAFYERVGDAISRLAAEAPHNFRTCSCAMCREEMRIARCETMEAARFEEMAYGVDDE